MDAPVQHDFDRRSIAAVSVSREWTPLYSATASISADFEVSVSREWTPLYSRSALTY